MEKYNKKTVCDNLKKYCYFANNDDFIEMTEWKNGEGYDINIDSHGHQKIFQLTNGEFDAIFHLRNILEFSDE